MAFDPKLLAPSAAVATLAKGAPKSVKNIALDSIDRQLALLADPKLEGKRTFRVVGEAAAFSIRVGAQSLELEVFLDGKPARTREASVPAKVLKDALLYYRGKVDAGDYKDQLDGLADGRTARVEKMRSTRAARRAQANA